MLFWFLPDYAPFYAKILTVIILQHNARLYVVLKELFWPFLKRENDPSHADHAVRTGQDSELSHTCRLTGCSQADISLLCHNYAMVTRICQNLCQHNPPGPKAHTFHKLLIPLHLISHQNYYITFFLWVSGEGNFKQHESSFLQGQKKVVCWWSTSNLVSLDLKEITKQLA
jgi:hypothetical protein